MQATPAAQSYTLSPVPTGLLFDSATGILSGPLTAGTWVFQVYGTNALGNGVSKTIQLEAYGSPSSLWQAQNFTSTDPAIIGWNANPSGDGVSNLMKYALGLPVFGPSLAGLPAMSIESHNGISYFVYTITKNSQATNVIFVPEISSTLAPNSWNSGSGFLTILEDTSTRLKVRDNTPQSSRLRAFFRLRVSLGN